MFMIIECFSSGKNFTLFYMHDIGRFSFFDFHSFHRYYFAIAVILSYIYCLGELLLFLRFLFEILRFYCSLQRYRPPHQNKDQNSSFKGHAPSPPTYFHLILSNVFYLKSNGNSQVRPYYFSVLKLRVTAPFYQFCLMMALRRHS